MNLDYLFNYSDSYYWTSIVFIIVATTLFHLRKSSSAKASIVSLMSAAFFMALYVATKDNYLNPWDEQFHALVAKNMAKNMLHPTLFPSNLAPYNYKNWAGNYTWVHKQPLYLWQMALCIKVFGNSVLAIRIPSVLMHILIVYPIYRIGKLLSTKKEIGFYAAVVFCGAYYPLQLISGAEPTDHNDYCFLFYTTMAHWSLIEYINNTAENKRKWILLIGLFSGCAILTKWLVGLIVFLTWAWYILLKRKFIIHEIKNYVIALTLTIFVAAPWQLYTLYKYPLETKYEQEFNRKHLTHALEGHGGDNMFHINALQTLYTYIKEFHVVLLLLIIITVVIILTKNKQQYLAMVLSVVCVYAFFTYVPTKMIGFCAFLIPLVIVCIVSAIYYLLALLLQKLTLRYSYVLPVTILVTIYFLFVEFNHKQIIDDYHSTSQNYSLNRRYFLMEAKKKIIAFDNMHHERYAVFGYNYDDFSNIPAMYYTNGLYYVYLPSEKEDYINLIKEGYTVYIINNGLVPEWVMQDKRLQLVNSETFTPIPIK